MHAWPTMDKVIKHPLMFIRHDGIRHCQPSISLKYDKDQHQLELKKGQIIKEDALSFLCMTNYQKIVRNFA